MSNLYKLIAKTGDNVTSLGSLTSFGNNPSINDLGSIAFVGQSNSSTDLLIENNQELIKNLSVAFVGRFSSAVQINNQNKVAARDSFLSGDSAIRVWDFNNPPTFNNPDTFQVIGTGAFPSASYDFENILPFPSLNNNGQVAFLADPKGSSNVALVTFKGTNIFNQRTYNESILSGNARPMIADNGNIVVRDPISRISLFDYQLNLIGVVASNLSGFNYVGLSPGISDDGKVVTFYGELSNPGATNLTLGLTPGPGIFANIDTGSGRKLVRLAGIAGNGILDPGENFADADGDGQVDAGEDKGLITSFARDE